MSDEPPDEHCVGVFWLVRDVDGTHRFLSDLEPLIFSQPEGDFLAHPRDHDEVWTGWQRLGATGLSARRWPLAILTADPVTFPRGQVAFNLPDDRFWIMADRRLHRLDLIDDIKTAFGLCREDCRVKSNGCGP